MTGLMSWMPHWLRCELSRTDRSPTCRELTYDLVGPFATAPDVRRPSDAIHARSVNPARLNSRHRAVWVTGRARLTPQMHFEGRVRPPLSLEMLRRRWWRPAPPREPSWNARALCWGRSSHRSRSGLARHVSELFRYRFRVLPNKSSAYEFRASCKSGRHQSCAPTCYDKEPRDKGERSGC